MIDTKEVARLYFSNFQPEFAEQLARQLSEEVDQFQSVDEIVQAYEQYLREEHELHNQRICNLLERQQLLAREWKRRHANDVETISECHQ